MLHVKIDSQVPNRSPFPFHRRISGISSDAHHFGPFDRLLELHQLLLVLVPFHQHPGHLDPCKPFPLGHRYTFLEVCNQNDINGNQKLLKKITFSILNTNIWKQFETQTNLILFVFGELFQAFSGFLQLILQFLDSFVHFGSDRLQTANFLAQNLLLTEWEKIRCFKSVIYSLMLSKTLKARQFWQSSHFWQY